MFSIVPQPFLIWDCICHRHQCTLMLLYSPGILYYCDTQGLFKCCHKSLTCLSNSLSLCFGLHKGSAVVFHPYSHTHLLILSRRRHLGCSYCFCSLCCPLVGEFCSSVRRRPMITERKLNSGFLFPPSMLDQASLWLSCFTMMSCLKNAVDFSQDKAALCLHRAFLWLSTQLVVRSQIRGS